MSKSIPETAANESYVLTPGVNATQEFIEIANDFANPLDLVREAISNAFDAGATNIDLIFEVQSIDGEPTFVVRIEDNGSGMQKQQLQAFFDLGNSTRRDDPEMIGEKGHGTKVYFNAKKLQVETQQGLSRLTATLASPFAKLHARELPTVHVTEERMNADASGTKITIYGYNNNRRDRFTHQRLKDHILWFTKFGSIEKAFDASALENIKIRLKGLDADKLETLSFGHPFPDESESVNDLFEKWTVAAPDYFCKKKIVKNGSLPKHPEIRYNAIFAVEGKRVRYNYNPMLRKPGYVAPDGSYTVQERYGFWLCKDFIPVQRKNEWVTTKGSEYTKLHAFLNCQALKLTANRGSIENTPAEILQDIEDVVRRHYRELTESDDWLQLDYLEEEAEGYNTVEREKKQFGMRVDKANRSNISVHNGVTLVEPQRESGVHALVVQLMQMQPDLFPFSIVDYDTHEGIDVIVKARDNVAVRSSKLYYVEFKFLLGKGFNHSFENLYSIVCWDTELKNGDVVQDINKEERKLAIAASVGGAGDYTHYFLENPRKAHRIEVFVLKDYLAQRLGISFRPRTTTDIV